MLPGAFTESNPVAVSLTAELNTTSEVTASLPIAASETETFQTSPSNELNGVDDKGAKPNIYLMQPELQQAEPARRLVPSV